MVRGISALVLLLLVWTTDDPSVPATLRVLTYNIHHGEGTDGRFDLSRTAGLITTAEPDLVALQEVDQGTDRAGGVDQVAELARLTSLHAAFGKAMDYGGGAYGVAVLSRWPLSRVETHPLPGATDSETRVALTVSVKAGERGPVLQFTSTHLDQGRDQGSRLEQAMSLNRLLVGDNDRAAILAGDMNARRDTDVMTILEGLWTNASASDSSPMSVDERPRLRGDYVLCRPMDEWRVVESRVIDERVASDHRPVLVVLEWTGIRK